MSASALAKTHAADYDLDGVPVEDMVLQAWNAKKQIEALTELVQSCNAALKERLAPGEEVRIPGVCRAAHILRTSIKIADPDKLRQALGPSFETLVKTSVSYAKTDKLEEIAFAGDGGILTEAVRSCLKIDTTEVIDYRAVQ